MADAFGHAATHAPQPMHAAASIARSAAGFGTRIEFASGALPVRVGNEHPNIVPYNVLECADGYFLLFKTYISDHQNCFWAAYI